MSHTITDAIAQFSPAQAEMYNGLIGELTQLAKKAPTAFDIKEMALNILGDKRLNAQSPDHLNAALRRVFGEKAQLTTKHINPNGTFDLASARAARNAMQVSVDDIAQVLPTVRTEMPSTVVSQPMTTENQVYAGLGLVSGAMSLLFAVDAFRHSTQKDDAGKTQVDWSQVMFGIMNTALAAGSFYIAHVNLKPRTMG